MIERCCAFTGHRPKKLSSLYTDFCPFALAFGKLKYPAYSDMLHSPSGFPFRISRGTTGCSPMTALCFYLPLAHSGISIAHEQQMCRSYGRTSTTYVPLFSPVQMAVPFFPVTFCPMTVPPVPLVPPR